MASINPMETHMTDKAAIVVADIARKHGVSPREARVALRAAGYRAPYVAKDLAKITAIIRGDKPKADTAKPAKRKAPAPVSA
jgi:hypothetical protein